MCPDNSNPRDNAPCNRQPFQSESGCDRGSVDVHQFDDLPYCGPLALTRPDIPPEVVDGPVPVPLPTFSCTCINIDHKFNLAYSRIGSGEDATPVAGSASDYRFDASVSFKAKGDCCEGNYESRLNLRIPCPVKCQTESSAPRLAVGIGYGNGPQSASASILRTNCESCTLEAIPASLNLNIPCPVTTGGEEEEKCAKLAPGVDFGPNGGKLSYKYLPYNPLALSNEPVWAVHSSRSDVTVYFAYRNGDWRPINVGPLMKNGAWISIYEQLGMGGLLDVHCTPASYDYNVFDPEDDKRLHVSIKYGSTPFRGDPSRNSSVSMSYLSYDEANCKIGPHTTRVKLSLPCPIKVPGKPWQRDVKLMTELVRPEELEDSGVEVLKLDSSICALIPPEDPEPITLQVRCPIVNKVSSGRIEMAVSYGTGPQKKPVLIMDELKCEIEAVEKEVHLNLPCPAHPSGIRTITALGATVPYATVNSQTCDIDFHDVRLPDIEWDAKCPVGKGGKGVLAFNPITFYKGTLHTATQEFVTKPNSRCGVDIGNMTFSLSVPCPIKSNKGKKKLRAKTTLGGLDNLGGVTGIGWESITFASIGESCSLALNGGSFNLKVPCPIGKDNLKIRAEATTTYASSASMYVESTTGEGCTRTITIYATIPKARPYWL